MIGFARPSAGARPGDGHRRRLGRIAAAGAASVAASALLLAGTDPASAATPSGRPAIIAQSGNVSTQTGLLAWFTATVAPGQDASKVTWSWANARTTMTSASPAGVTLAWRISVSGSVSTLTMAALDAMQVKPRLGDSAGRVVNYSVQNASAMAPRFRAHPTAPDGLPVSVPVRVGKPNQFDGRTLGAVTAVYWQVYSNASAPFGWVTISAPTKELSVTDEIRGSVLSYTPTNSRFKVFRAVAVNFFGATVCTYDTVGAKGVTPGR